MRKRIFDLILALILIIPAVFILALVALWVRFDSAGPVFFRQTRVGQNESAFQLLKLRTMHANTGDHASHEAPKNAITRAGRQLRRFKIDELPQIWNVLMGDMCFVGPRPCLFLQTELIAARRAHGVAHLRPGITGTGQVAGLDMSTPERLARADANYLGPWSLKRDVALLWQTFTGAGRGDAAAK